MKGTAKALLILTLLRWGEGVGRSRRGFSGYGDLNGQRQLTYDYLNDNQNIALWSAQSAVTSSVGQVYGAQQALLADAVRQFVTPKKGSSEGSNKSHYSKAERFQAPYQYELESPRPTKPSRPRNTRRPPGHSRTPPWRPSRKLRPRRPQRRPSKE